MRGIPLGITLAEYRAITPFSDNGYINPRSACSDQPMPDGVRLEDVPPHDTEVGVVSCQWFSDMPGLSFKMVTRHFIALGEGSGPPGFAFISDGRAQRLFRIGFKANSDYYAGIHAALFQNYGAPKVVTSIFLTQAGGQFPNATSTWDNGVSSIVLEQRCGQTDRYCLTYRHKALSQVYDRLIAERARLRGAKI
ncbi:hypothetical protein [Sphingomonas prati]|uniref:Uncharacterized protein n=1 Tax=Sphingomonas prati TaxID=1843237 RepID=A0A7W9F2Z2_9SPHN|nr:hypothetical protein [Sphingomonas prati]MBB5730938.1 hypothetical protein [Sphingomonas prati]GGE97861.1 hypothetical protein GCM10011404_33740 [Sphingomonas prati]